MPIYAYRCEHCGHAKDVLQKTLINIEGLGRMLDPDLDLWTTAKPFLENWMQTQLGLPALRRRLLAEAPYIMAALPELPRLIHQRLSQGQHATHDAMRELASAQRVRNRWLALLAALIVIVAIALFLHLK
jgi:ubiquinone biosynthesis protein